MSMTITLNPTPSLAAYKAEILYRYAQGTENAYEAFKTVYTPEPEENDLQFIGRCIEQDYDDAAHGGAVYQELYDALAAKEANVWPITARSAHLHGG